MGNSQSAKCTLSREEIGQFVSSTVFTSDEIRALWFHYRNISNSQETINRDQFRAAILFRDSALLDRIFRVFDENDDNSISFLEYISCLSVISSKATRDSKLRFSFKLYDFDGDDMISADDLTSMLAATLREDSVVVSREHLDEIVEATMKEASPEVPGKISFIEYQSLVTQRPHMLAHLSMNISSIIDEYTKMSGISFATPRPV